MLIQRIITLLLHSSVSGGNGARLDMDWNRRPGQPCLFPNVFFDISPTSDFGGFCCSYSPCGVYLAWTTANADEHCLILQSALGKMGTFGPIRTPAHLGLIYDLDWSNDSTRIAICSADQTATVWQLPDQLASASALRQLW